MPKRVPRAESFGLRIANQAEGGDSVAETIQKKPGILEMLGAESAQARSASSSRPGHLETSTSVRLPETVERNSHLSGRAKAANDALKIRFGESPIIHVDGHVYDCPSQSSSDYYEVDLERVSCKCAHWKKQSAPGIRFACKHIIATRMWAAEMEHGIPPKPDGTTLKYPGKPGMRRIARVEKAAVQILVGELVKNFPDAQPTSPGRPQASLAQLVGCGLSQAYTNAPSRKALHDVDEDSPFARTESQWTPGFVLERAYPAEGTLLRAMTTERMGDALRKALGLTIAPVLDVEKVFGFDSTQVRSPLSELVYVRKNGESEARIRSKNMKLHFAGGCATMMIFGAMVSMDNAHDSPFFLPLLNSFKDRVRVSKVCADAAYDAYENFEAVARLGGRAFIDFAAGTKPRGDGSHFDQQLAMHTSKPEEYKAEYDIRALIESINSAFKRNGRKFLRSRRRESLEAEVLLLVVKYNLCRLLIVRREHGIAIPWCSDEALAEIDELIGHVLLDDLKSTHTEHGVDSLAVNADESDGDVGLPITGT